MSGTSVATETFDCRQAFAAELISLARTDPRIVAVCNDSVGSSNLTGFAAEFPDRLINVGIAEQNMVGVAAGLANGGYIPFVCAAAPFLSGRATEQIKSDIAYNGYHVVLCGMSPGMAYGELGPTHHSIEDLSWMRAISDLIIVVPADPQQTRDVMRWAVNTDKPSYLRIGRVKVPAVTPEGTPFELGKALQLRDGNDVTLVATGVTVSRALDAAELLSANGISARVLNVATIVPLDDEAIVRAATETGRIVTIEEGRITGGLGAAVSQTVVRTHPVPMRLLGVGGFAPTGKAEFLYEYFGIDAPSIAAAARELVG